MREISKLRLLVPSFGYFRIFKNSIVDAETRMRVDPIMLSRRNIKYITFVFVFDVFAIGTISLVVIYLRNQQAKAKSARATKENVRNRKAIASGARLEIAFAFPTFPICANARSNIFFL